jgi:hypothetical protein
MTLKHKQIIDLFDDLIGVFISTRTAYIHKVSNHYDVWSPVFNEVDE